MEEIKFYSQGFSKTIQKYGVNCGCGIFKILEKSLEEAGIIQERIPDICNDLYKKFRIQLQPNLNWKTTREIYDAFGVEANKENLEV